jgi:hypothetical protein
MAVVLDMNTGIIQKIDAFDTCYYQMKKPTDLKVLRSFLNAGVIYIFTADKRFMLYNTHNHQITTIISPITMTAEMIQQLSEDALQALLKGLESGVDIKPQQDDPVGYAGVKIFQHCKKAIGI